MYWKSCAYAAVHLVENICLFAFLKHLIWSEYCILTKKAIMSFMKCVDKLTINPNPNQCFRAKNITVN